VVYTFAWSRDQNFGLDLLTTYALGFLVSVLEAETAIVWPQAKVLASLGLDNKILALASA